MMDLAEYIRDVPDFPKAGILFKDITPLLQDARALKEAVTRIGKFVEAVKPDAVIGIESRGFIFGAPIALQLGLPFIPVRKPGKLPSEKMSVEYELEYGNGKLDIHKDALKPGQKVVVIDDLLATGGTARAACRLAELLGASVEGVFFLIELAALNGVDKLQGYNCRAVLKY